MAKKNIEDYEMVDSRLNRFWAAHPQGRVLTELVFHDERRFIVKSEIYFDSNDLTPVATGYAEEIVGASPVNRTSALENCETSSIGRGLANCGFQSEIGKRPSREEMEKVERYDSEPRKSAKPKVTYTEEQIKDAGIMITTAIKISTLDELRQVWTKYADYLDIPVDNTTLKDAINARVKELS
jgi:hypothetical protein